ncbi:MAG: signal peptidase I [Legionellales bacterium]|jgi:signal peptidase I|nr:signal peptidase I [Legionellales bacterium]
MEIIMMLKIFVCLALAISMPIAIHDRYVLQADRIKNNIPRPEFYNQLYETIPLFLIGFFMIFFTLEQVLTTFTLLAVAIVIFAKIFLQKKYKTSHSIILEQAKSYAGVLLIIWTIRSFIIQPYVVPTGSLEPTIQPGDFIIVSQYSYGIRVPILGDTIFAVNKPQRGEIALFRWPQNKDILFIKRVIGIPGDHIVYKNKTLYINGKTMEQNFIANDYKLENSGDIVMITKKQEDLLGHKHEIQQYANTLDNNTIDITVPEGQYFMMGDNRDNSSDSRVWGMVPDKNFVGKAQNIWLSINTNSFGIMWDRIGNKIL